MLRPRLSTLVGDQGNQGHRTITRLSSYDPRLLNEANFWQARHFEQLKELENSQSLYEKVLASESNLFHLNSFIKSDLHAMAHAGLARLGAASPPSWLRPQILAAFESEEQTIAWNIPGGLLSEPLVYGETLFAYRQGDVHAQPQ